MALLDPCSESAVHTRNISISTYACETDRIVVEGVLRDDRLTSHYTFENERLPPDTIHHMVLRLKIDCTTLTIEAVEVEMPGTPKAECRETRSSLDVLQGMRIAPGFTAAAKKAAGGVKGCVHLNALLMAMAPAALQGHWANESRKPENEQPTAYELEQYLVDTCHVWRREGPVAQKRLKKTIE